MAELRDPNKPLKTSRLVNLSLLAPAEVMLVKRNWGAVGLERRRQVVTRLLDLAEDNLEMDFDEVFRVCLDDSDEQVRLKAIEGLWECDSRSLIDVFLNILAGDSQESVQAAAATALGKFVMLAELGKLRADDSAKMESALLSVIKGTSQGIEVRRHALEAIGSLSKPYVKELIRWAYESDSFELQLSALHAMGRNCDAVWLPILLKEMENPDPERRFEAATACGELEEEAIPHLAQLLHDTDLQVRFCAIEALGQIGGSEARLILRRCLSDPDEQVREAAEEALEELEFGEKPLFGM